MIFINKILRTLQSIGTYTNCLRSSIGYDRTWIVVGTPIVRRGSFLTRLFQKNCRVLSIGKGFKCYNNNKSELGAPTPCIFNLLSPNSTIIIGDNVGLTATILNCRDSINIGNNVNIGSGCLIVDNDSHPLNPSLRRTAQGAEGVKSKAIVIQDDVFIGARSIILKGVTVGTASVIGAGSVITHDIPPYSIACGNPAVVVKKITENE